MSYFLQKRAEKETRIFNAKFDAYSAYIRDLRGLFTEKMKGIPLTSEGAQEVMFKLEVESSRVVLVAPEEIRRKVGRLNSKLYRLAEEGVKLRKQGKGISDLGDRDKKGLEERVREIIKLRTEITKLMRKDMDIGVQRNSSSRTVLNRIKKKLPWKV